MIVEITDKGQDYLAEMNLMEDWTKGNSAKDFYFLAVIRERGFVDIEDYVNEFNKNFPYEYKQVARRLFEAGHIEEVG